MNKPALFLMILGATVIGFASAQTPVSQDPKDFCYDLHVSVCNNANLDCSSNIENACLNAWHDIKSKVVDHSSKETLFVKLTQNVSPLICTSAKIALNRMHEDSAKSNDKDCQNPADAANVWPSNDAHKCQSDFERIVRSKLEI